MDAANSLNHPAPPFPPILIQYLTSSSCPLNLSEFLHANPSTTAEASLHYHVTNIYLTLHLQYYGFPGYHISPSTVKSLTSSTPFTADPNYVTTETDYTFPPSSLKNLTVHLLSAPSLSRSVNQLLISTLSPIIPQLAFESLPDKTYYESKLFQKAVKKKWFHQLDDSLTFYEVQNRLVEAGVMEEETTEYCLTR